MRAFVDAARRGEAGALALAISVIGAATILGAYYFQYVLGYAPCPLCLEQRVAYYVAIPLGVLLWLGARYGAARRVLMLGFICIVLGMGWNAGLAGYHAGVEWKFWPGPVSCSGQLGTLSGGGLLNQLQSVRVVSCDEAAWRFLGLSLAGWNVPISLLLAALALCGAFGVHRAGARKED